jgi:CRP/FNR family transcriptional regulator
MRAPTNSVKQHHISVPPGTDIVIEGERSQGVYSVCDGWAVRYRQLAPGVRQILDVLLPGDTVALASAIFGQSQHSVQAVTAASVCLLNGRQIVSLLKTNPGFAFGVLQVRMEDERRADARLTMLGRMSAEGKLAYFMVETYDRLRRRGMADDTSCPFPLRRNDVADAVGLSKVHVSRALRELRSQALVDIRGQNMIIPDVAKLAGHAGYVLQ